MASLTPQMMVAARDGDASAVSKALATGLSPDASNPIGQTSLMVASIWGHTNVGEVLLDAGANPNQPNHDGQTPLIFAVKNGKLAMAKLLLERGAVRGHTVCPPTPCTFHPVHC